MLLNSVHKILGSFVFWYNFLNFFIKENTFSFFDEILKLFSICYQLGESVHIQFNATLLIPPYFEMFSDVDVFGKFILNRIWNFYIFLNNSFKRFSTQYIWYINTFQSICKLSDKLLFFFAIPNNCTLLVLNKILINRYVNS